MSFGSSDFRPPQPPGSNPFGNIPYGQSPYKPPGDPRQDPYGPPPKADRGFPRWLLFLLLGLFGCSVVVCACCGGLTYWGVDLMGDDVGNSLAGNPVIEEHIGEVQKCTWNMSASMEHSDDDVFVFDIEGSKGKGQIVGKLDDDSSALESGELHMPKGSYNLFP